MPDAIPAEDRTRSEIPDLALSGTLEFMSDQSSTQVLERSSAQSVAPPIQGLLGGVAAWDGNKLAITSPAAVKKTRRDRLSPSTAKSMHSCAARWAGEKLLPRLVDPFGPAELGTGAHNVLEELFALPPAERTVARAATIRKKHALKEWPETGRETDAEFATLRLNRDRWNEEVETAYLGLWAIEDPATINVHSVEQQFDVDLDGVPSTGKVDRIEEIEINGRIELLVDDYKSSKKLPDVRYDDEHGDQIRVYFMLIEKKLGKLPVGGQLLYTRIGKLRNDESPKNPIDVSPAALATTLKWFKLAWKRHNRYHDEALFPTKVSPLCGYCPLIAACPAAKAQGKTVAEAKRGVFSTAEELGLRTLAEVKAGAIQAPSVRNAIESSIPTSPESEDPMSHLIAEDDESIATVGKSNDLNPNSFAAAGTFGLVNLSTDILQSARPAFGLEDVHALSSALAFIVAEAQEEWTGGRDPQAGAAISMRATLSTFLKGNPPPLDGTQEDFEGWVDDAINRLVAATGVVLDIFASAPGEDAWAKLNPLVIEAKPVKTPARRASKAAAAKVEPTVQESTEEPTPAQAEEAAVEDPAEETIEPKVAPRARTTRTARTPAPRRKAEDQEAVAPEAEPEAPAPAEEAEVAPESTEKPAARTRASRTTSTRSKAKAADEPSQDAPQTKKRASRDDDWASFEEPTDY